MNSSLIEPNSTLNFIVPDALHPSTPLRMSEGVATTETSTPSSKLEERSRIDTFLANYFTLYSRNFFQNLIDQKTITLNNRRVTKYSISVKPGDELTVHFPPLPTLASKNIPGKDLAVKIIFEHEHFLLISKPAGLMVHAPSPHSSTVTLVDWLITHFSEIATVGNHDRPGIVHRLDKDTSGIMVIPRNNYALAQFGDMFKNRTIHKKYLAVVEGRPEESGTIDYRIDRHRTEPHKMTHLYGSGREALTHFIVKEYFKDSALIEVSPITGRTHQIRVHCAAIDHPIVGDQLYGNKSPLIKRQALHASEISFNFEGEGYSFTAELPEELKNLIALNRG